jgi:hypothetical protein
MKLRLSAVFASLALISVLSAAPVFASPLVLPSVTVLGDGTYEYGYNLSNLVDSTENVFDFGLYFTGEPLDIFAPSNWDYIAGTGFINWFSLAPEFDLTAGSSLDFSFRSALAPGDITYSTLGANSLTGDVGATEFGDTRGPVSQVPEPGTLSLLGAGCLVAWFAQRRRSHSTS